MSQILLVDDNAVFCQALCQTLARAGHEVRTAANGAVALKLFLQGATDLVITDLIMPEREGLETIMALRQLRPDIRIIAISGGGRMEPSTCLAMAEHLGAARTLAKPFTARAILEAVAAVLAEEPEPAPSPVSA